MLVRHKLMPDEIDAAIVACLHIFAARGRAIREAEERRQTDCPDVAETDVKRIAAEGELGTANENRNLRSSDQGTGGE